MHRNVAKYGRLPFFLLPPRSRILLLSRIIRVTYPTFFSQPRFCMRNYTRHAFAITNHTRYALPQKKRKITSRNICFHLLSLLLLPCFLYHRVTSLVLLKNSTSRSVTNYSSLGARYSKCSIGDSD